MEFDEVSSFINQDTNNESGTSLDNTPIYNHVISNPYNTLLSQHSAVNRKPTLSNLVHRLKGQSTMTRFERNYKRNAALNVSEADGSEADDDASIRVIDPSREAARGSVPSPSDDSEVANLVVAAQETTSKQKKPTKRVQINESANQIQPPDETVKSFHEPNGDLSNHRFVTLQAAIDYMNQDIEHFQDEIEKEVQKIMLKQEEITRYREEFEWMKTQMGVIHYSLTGYLKDNIPEMKAIRDRVIESEQKVKLNRKKNILQRQRFEKYRKAISIETRLIELEKKIVAAWRRDEIWAGIRDWGFLSILLLSLIVTSFLAWRS